MSLPTTGTPGTTHFDGGLPYHWLNGRWQHGPDPADRSASLSRLEYDPELADGARLNWVDIRDETETVPDRTALLGIPASHLATGKLVYVVSESTMFKFVADPAKMAGDISDWDPLVYSIALTEPPLTNRAPGTTFYQNGFLWMWNGSAWIQLN